MHCPFHHDVNRSASLNVESELWYCNTCDIGGAVDELVQRLESGEGTVAYWTDAKPSDFKKSKKGGGNGAAPKISEAQVRGFHSGLLARDEELEELMSRRGLNMESIERWQIGWDSDQDAYTIPIRDVNGEVINIRFYQLDPGDDRRKIWSVLGHGEPVLYPISELDGNNEIIVCEGEWDALLTIQQGFPAITRTGAAKVWKDSWNPLFEDKVVFCCHDMDEPGQLGNLRVQAALQDYAAAVHILKLPFRVVPKNGKDLTDFWLAGFEPQDFKNFMYDSPAVFRDPELVEDEYVEVPVLDTFDASKAGKKMRMRATIVGKRQGKNYLLPKEVDYTCTQDAGPQCQVCPMLGYNGQAARHISGQDPVSLRLMESSEEQREVILRKHLGAQKCNRLDIEARESRTAQILYVRSSVETGRADHTAREIVSLGNHDAEANRTVEVVGTIYPDPRTSVNQFQAWEVARTTTSLDDFELTDDAIVQMLKFQHGPKGPTHKVKEIADELANGVTKIYGRNRMHAIMDLTWHSALAFDFAGVRQNRGWLDVLIIGDTRTGKSEAAGRLRDWYDAGEMISCEAASFAGVVGGAQTLGSKEWVVTWGAIPLNDRRMVVLDEVSGLTPGEISRMSSIRSSGIADITKISTDRTLARTRLLWLGNPRDKGMADFTYGVYAIAPLIGNKEDIARFDLAMTVRSDEVDSDVINRPYVAAESSYSREACQTLLRWVWSRKPEQIKWGVGAEPMVLEVSKDLGELYVEDPPLVQAANVRFKVARLAVAVAARTFSTDRTFENIVVNTEHVLAAEQIIKGLYGDPGFGYLVLSQERKDTVRTSVVSFDEAKQWLHEQPDLTRFLRNQREGHFRRQDLEDMLTMDRDLSGTTVNKLFGFGLVRKDRANIEMEPVLHQILRELHKEERDRDGKT